MKSERQTAIEFVAALVAADDPENVGRLEAYTEAAEIALERPVASAQQVNLAILKA